MLSAKHIAEAIRSLMVVSLCLNTAYGGEPAPASADAIRYAPFIPEKADVFFRMDFGALRTTKAFPELRANVKEGLEKLHKEFLHATGVPLDDVEVLVVTGVIESDPAVAMGVMELKQPITEEQLVERMHKAAKSAGKAAPKLQTIEVAGRSAFVNLNAGPDEICLINEKTVLIGSKGQLTELLRRDKTSEPQQLFQAIRRLDFGKILTVAAKVPSPKGDATAAIAHVEYVFVEATVDDLVRAEVVLACVDEELAEQTALYAQV